ncbi:DUF3422 family protein [Paracoccus pacificus]|uniref:DUF3422 family protein n=1 Tax=Paracoccus pacificus TaxID=1463598 RepID=A0ABW4R4I1_9RHOB
MAPMDEHPLRYQLVNELHARPSPLLSAPCTVVYVAFKEPKDAANRDLSADVDHLAELARRHGAPAPDPQSSHYAARAGRYDLRWEQHTEFVTYAGFFPGLPATPFDPATGAIFPEEWQARAPGLRVASVMVQVALLPENAAEIQPLLDEWFVGDSLAAFWVLDESAVVAGDFRIDPAGWMRFAVFVRPGVGDGRIGRIVQRLLEIETYRAMSMLGLEQARGLNAQMNALEPQLSGLVADMSGAAENGNPERTAEQTLNDLLTVSSALERLAMRSTFRLGATAAYEAIVTDRINVLRETRFTGRQTLTEFMMRRYDPAMRTVKSAKERLRSMIERAARAGELLRTRVDVYRSAQNQQIMTRMDRRADLQLRLQHTVEGLSVVAISYYAVGLLGYMLGPPAEAIGIEKAVLTALLVPVVVLCVWLGMRRIRRRLHDHDQE